MRLREGAHHGALVNYAEKQPVGLSCLMSGKGKGVPPPSPRLQIVFRSKGGAVVSAQIIELAIEYLNHPDGLRST